MFSKRARYALHGIGFLAHNHTGKPISFDRILEYLEDYSRELTLSPAYIKKIFQDLSRSGIVRPIVGRKGGYLLGREPERVRIIEVVAAVDGAPVEECCLLSVGGCDRQALCGVYSVINGAQRQFYDFLSKETAATLARKMFGRPTSTKRKPPTRKKTRGRPARSGASRASTSAGRARRRKA